MVQLFVPGIFGAWQRITLWQEPWEIPANYVVARCFFFFFACRQHLLVIIDIFDSDALGRLTPKNGSRAFAWMWMDTLGMWESRNRSPSSLSWGLLGLYLARGKWRPGILNCKRDWCYNRLVLVLGCRAPSWFLTCITEREGERLYLCQPLPSPAF